MVQPYHLTLWSYWQLMDCMRLDRILAEHDRIDAAYLTHYAVNHPDGLKQRDQAFRMQHTYQTPTSDVLAAGMDLLHGIQEVAALNERVNRRQRRQVH
jgi:hypothetical protein